MASQVSRVSATIVTFLLCGTYDAPAYVTSRFIAEGEKTQ
jgi:hypothetical protein